MKKIFSVFLVLCLLFLFSCNDGDVTTTTSTTSSTTLSSTTSTVTQPQEPVAPTGIFSLELYQRYLAENEMPSNFITYEKVSVLGTFRGFDHLLESYGAVGRAGDIRYYFRCPSIGEIGGYYLTFAYGRDLFWIEPDPNDEDWRLLDLTPSGKDLRTFSSAFSGLDWNDYTKEMSIIEINGMRYWYIENDLHQIDLPMPDGTYSSLSVHRKLRFDGFGCMSKHNPDCDCLLSKFLHADTCQQAKETLMASIFGTE